MNTYELSARWREVADLCVTFADENEGQIPAELLRLFNEIEGSLDEKLDQLCAIIRELAQHEAALRAEADFFQTKAQKVARHSKRLEGVICDQLKANGWQKRKVSERFTVAIQKSAPHVVVNDITIVPHIFDKPREISFSEIGKALKDGQDVPGAELVASSHLRIR